MDLEQLAKLLQILDERGIASFEIEEQGLKLRVRKGVAVATLPAAPAPTTAPQRTVAAEEVSLASAAPSAPAHAANGVAADAGLVVIKSPIVGTFYRAPDPNAAPFVEVGDSVRLGQVICIIEAMKLMNEIEADHAGEVVRIHPENGQPVQFGDPLMTLRQS